jgi:hypothetical protein
MEAREVDALRPERHERRANVIGGEYGGAVGSVPGHDEACVRKLGGGGYHRGVVVCEE